MQIALGSIFRNSTKYLHRYFQQVDDLRQLLEKDGNTLRLILVEGDSTDGTWSWLNTYADPIKAEHGGPEFGSIDTPQRWQQISMACNTVLENVSDSDDLFIWVESDLIWTAETMVSLIDQLGTHAAQVICPMCYGADGLFYDTWGYRKDGVKFSKQPPYHPAVNGEVTTIDSAGSCIAMFGYVARECRFDPPEMGIVGFCRQITNRSYSILLNPNLEVRHP